MHRNRSTVCISRWAFVSLQLLLTVPCLLTSIPAFAAKVIMKDGKIYEGKIIAETDGDVLIKPSGLDRRARLLPGSEILSVVHDPPESKPQDSLHYAAFEMLMTGNVFSSDPMSMDPAVSLWLGGELRFHPLVAIGGGLDWKPALSGDLEVTDGTTSRGYQKFFSYGGGFHAKIYPFYTLNRWKMEPFLIVGYQWNQLIPKASGDSMQGHGPNGGIGAQWPLARHLFLQTSFVFQHTAYDKITFHGNEGTFSSPIRSDNYAFSTGLSIHF